MEITLKYLTFAVNVNLKVSIVIGRKFSQRACELAFAMSGKELLRQTVLLAKESVHALNGLIKHCQEPIGFPRCLDNAVGVVRRNQTRL